MQSSEDRRIRRADNAVKMSWRHFKDEWIWANKDGTDKDLETVNRLRGQVEKELVRLVAIVEHDEIPKSGFPIIEDVEACLPEYPILPMGSRGLIPPMLPLPIPIIATANHSTQWPTMGEPTHESLDPSPLQ